jgi:hypothetical protein
MRNLIWSSAALVLVLGAGLFMAARHAARHPDSAVARLSMTVYRLCDALLAPRMATKPAEEVAQATQATPITPTLSDPATEPVEPIIIEPTDQEPPLGIPRLSPEVAAAIERLRSEEESEDPPQPFDGPGFAPRMPYADEVEVLPLPTPDPANGHADQGGSQPESGGFFFLPSISWEQSIWQTFLDKAVEALRGGVGE